MVGAYRVVSAGADLAGVLTLSVLIVMGAVLLIALITWQVKLES